MEKEVSILIIDDEPVAREALESVLINQGYNLFFAHSGPEGLTKATEIIPDVVLLDVMMPGMDGFEVCQKLRKDPLLAEVPIILITALDDKNSRLLGLEVGADDFISKPFDRIELRTRLRSITRLNRYRNLLNERSKISWIIDQAKDGYILINNSGNILYSNKPASKYFNDSIPENLIGKNFIELASFYYNLVPEIAWQNWPNIKANHYLVKPETENNRAVFLLVDMFFSTRSFDPSWLISIRDVTENTNLQSEVWKFHSAVSHKLRSPLTITLSSLELLSQELSDQELSNQESIKELLDMAINSSKKLYDNIQTILSFVTSRNVPCEGKSLQLTDIFEVLKELTESLSIEPISMFGFEELDEIKLNLSSQAFTIIAKEILENSKKFHPEKAPKIEIHFSKENDKVVLIISDDGKNLPQEQLEQVWRPYYQAEKHLTGQILGMGLGLSMVSTLVWRVAGQCHIYNRTDKPGLSIKLVFPIFEEESE
ncbi:MAG: response regulator [Acidobacteria bacterium]|nr:response regulator [Acidobacteriota bacterium]